MSRLPDLPRTSVYQQLRPTPRVFVFAALLLSSATSLGAKEVARWQFLHEAFDSEWGIGSAAAIAALAAATTSLIIGRVIDRCDPRPFLLAALGMAAITNTTIALVLVAGPIAPMWVVAASVVDGVMLGAMGVAVVKTQAALVNPGATGAAEIVNILRLGVGGVIGAVLGGMSPNPSVTLLAGAVLLMATFVGLWIVMRPVTPRRSERGATGARAVLAYLAQVRGLRGLVAIDLALAFVVPTQLVNLVLIGMEAPELASLSIAAGMAGVLVGRLALVVLGFRGAPRRLLTISVLGLAACQGLGAVGLNDAWLLRQLVALPTIIIVGTILSTYGQGLTAAIIQQEVSEEHRGGVSSILVAGRNVLISLAALAGAALAVALGPQALLVCLASGLILVLVLSRRFAAVPS